MGSWAGLHPEVERRVRAMLAETGGGLTSGYRSYAEQKRLYDGWVNRLPGFAPANPPCRSNHEAIPCGGRSLGLAVDLWGPLATMGRVCGRFGLHRPIAGEPWHFQPGEVRSGSFTGMPLPVPPDRPPEPPPPPERSRLPEEEPMNKIPLTPRRGDRSDLRLLWAETDGWPPHPKARVVSHLHFALHPDGDEEHWGKKVTVKVYGAGMGTHTYTLGYGVPETPGAWGIPLTGNGDVRVWNDDDVPMWAEHLLFQTLAD